MYKDVCFLFYRIFWPKLVTNFQIPLPPPYTFSSKQKYHFTFVSLNFSQHFFVPIDETRLKIAFSSIFVVEQNDANLSFLSELPPPSHCSFPYFPLNAISSGRRSNEWVNCLGEGHPPSLPSLRLWGGGDGSSVMR